MIKHAIDPLGDGGVIVRNGTVDFTQHTPQFVLQSPMAGEAKYRCNQTVFFVRGVLDHDAEIFGYEVACRRLRIHAVNGRADPIWAFDSASVEIPLGSGLEMFR